MGGISATVLDMVKNVQLALKVLYALNLTAWHFPPTCTIIDGAHYDFIIVGGGTAGSVLANKLTASGTYSVLLIEAGGHSPLEADIAGLFPTLPNSDHDYNYTSVNDGRTAQNMDDGVVCLTAGKMLGGSSALDHLMHAHGHPHDYDTWADMLGDDSWNYNNVVKYLNKQEQLTDPDLLTTDAVNNYGTTGPIKIRRQTSPENEGIFAAAKELGHNIITDGDPIKSTHGISEPLLHIDNHERQSAGVTYLGEAKSRSNLCLSLYTTATKIIFKDKTAIGVQVVDMKGNEYILYANKEVVISAGTLNSPKLLMLSGVGPKRHLKSKGIKVVANLPVGQNFQDHTTVVAVYQLGNDTSTPPATNPADYPAPMSCLYSALNSSQPFPDYQAINFIFPHESTAQVQLCRKVFKYSDDICNAFYAASIDRKILFLVMDLMMPKSRGKILLASADYRDNPLVYTGAFSDKNGEDLDLMTDSLMDFDRLTNTSYFKSVNAKLVDVGLCSNLTGRKFWKCYALALSTTLWHYTSTCSMGNVLDTKLRVRGIKNLRVIDASSMPTEVSGNIKAAVVMVAERGAEFLLENA